jgi:hypothetical protein
VSLRSTLLGGLLLVVAACDGALVGGARPAPAAPPFVAPPAPPAEVAPGPVASGPAQLRLLSALEYRNTMQDLLGLEGSAPLSHADWGTGFDTGAAGEVQEALLSTLLDESQALAARYVRERLRGDFPCFDAANVTDGCVRSVLTGLGRRAWRRPLRADEQADLFAGFTAAASTGGGRVAGLEALITRLLLSPRLLYRSEIGAPSTSRPGLRELDAFERASFLAYALTGSMPDEALLADAEAGALDEARLAAHARRLWGTPRARARVADLVRQWLGLTALDDMAARPGDYAKLTPALATALKQEFDGTVAQVLFDGPGTLEALLTASEVLGNQHTAPLYGLGAAGDALTPLSLPASERRGLLTLASTMAALSSSGDPSKDRPVQRALMVKSRLLCEPVGPPSGVNTVAAADTARAIPDFEQLTTRAQYEAMMQQGPECASCHATFMPLGFAFGRYDALGRFRATQRERPVDASAEGVPLLGEARRFADALELIDVVARHPQTARCFTQRVTSWSTGLRGTDYDATLGEALAWRHRGEPLHVGALIEQLLTAPENFVREGTTEEPPPLGAGGGGGDMTGGSAGGGAGGATVEALLPAGAALRATESRRSADGAFTLVLQGDGNFVLYRTGGAAIWHARTHGRAPGQAVMQGDGNLVVYDAGGVARFNTRTSRNPGASLFLEPSGRLSVRTPAGRELWNSITGRTP